MNLVKSVPEISRAAADTPPGRDRAVDVARLAALVVVMFGHCTLLLATADSRGLRIGNLLGALPALNPLTWLVQIMPLFFLAGGAAGAYGYRSGTPWGSWLFARAQRLCRPVFWYLAAWTVPLLAVRMSLGADCAAGLGRGCVGLLWFLGVYLVVLAFVPALTRLETGVRSRSWSRPSWRPRPSSTGFGSPSAHPNRVRQLRDRLADPGGDRRRLRTPTHRLPSGPRRGRRGPGRAGSARHRRQV